MSSYTRALRDQPRYSLFSEPLATLVPTSLFLIGQILVITSTFALGITGTFLGDYFGILLDHRVEGFPFNIVENPMYIGSTLCFAAGALWYVREFLFVTQPLEALLRYERPVGLLIAAVVYIVYTIALRFEGLVVHRDRRSPSFSPPPSSRPFTEMIYASRPSSKSREPDTAVKKEL